MKTPKDDYGGRDIEILGWYDEADWILSGSIFRPPENIIEIIENEDIESPYFINITVAQDDKVLEISTTANCLGEVDAKLAGIKNVVERTWLKSTEDDDLKE